MEKVVGPSPGEYDVQRLGLIEINGDIHSEMLEHPVETSRLVVETNFDVDHLDDGYVWRKYGQKAVRGVSAVRYAVRCAVRSWLIFHSCIREAITNAVRKAAL